MTTSRHLVSVAMLAAMTVIALGSASSRESRSSGGVEPRQIAVPDVEPPAEPNAGTEEASGSALPSDDPAERAAAIAEARVILREVAKLEQLGRGMEPLRRSSNLSALKRCGQQMQQRQGMAKALAARAEKLPMIGRLSAVGPATLVELCVSCMDDGVALGQCDQVRDELAFSEELLAEE